MSVVFGAYQDWKKMHPYEGNAFMPPALNKIMTYVVSDKERVIIKGKDGKEYAVQWNPLHGEPEVIEPGTTAVRYRGIVSVIDWLKSVKAGAYYSIDTNKKERV